MLLLRSLDNLPAELRGGAVAIGNFDGVHRGHQALLDRTQPGLPMKPGRAGTMTHDYKRHERLAARCICLRFAGNHR